MTLMWLLACAPPPVPEAPPTAAPTVFVPLSDARLARRISIDLRGALPTADEIARAENGELDALIDEWMEEPRFEEHLADVFAETWLLHVDELRVDAMEFGLREDETYAFTRAAGDEPARLMARIAATDRPWSDIVTTDTTLVNDVLAEFVPVELVDPTATGEWREARYTDGRPAAGVLATSGLWLRYHTTIFNYNRGRAAAIGNLLLCYDFLSRPVVFTAVEDNTTAGLQEAVQTDPGCIACHATLDPLASSLFGFWPFEDKDGVELVTYHPERERYGEVLTGAAPAWFGTPMDGPAQLGPLVAADPRFETCAATRAIERLWGRGTDAEDLRVIVGARDTFREGGLAYKTLLRAVIGSAEYRAGDLTDDATDEQRARHRPIRLMTPLTLADVIEDLTGFRWIWEGWDELDSDNTGFRLLLGGADGDMVRVTNLEPGLSRALVIRRLAQAAAESAVASDLAVPREARRLLGTLTEGDAFLDPADDAFLTELTAVHLRLFGVPPTDEQIADETTLYTDVLALSDATTAWESVLTVLLRDPELWSY